MIVKELITKLEMLENQDVIVHVEAPLYDGDNHINPYQWPLHDFSIEIWDIEEEDESDGETILLKSCTTNKISITPDQLLLRAANNLKKWLEMVDGVDPNGVEYAMYNSLLKQINK